MFMVQRSMPCKRKAVDEVTEKDKQKADRELEKGEKQ